MKISLGHLNSIFLIVLSTQKNFASKWNINRKTSTKRNKKQKTRKKRNLSDHIFLKGSSLNTFQIHNKLFLREVFPSCLYGNSNQKLHPVKDILQKSVLRNCSMLKLSLKGIIQGVQVYKSWKHKAQKLLIMN